MVYLKFFTSKTLFILIIKAAFFLIFFIIIILKALELTTYHDNYELVPDISGFELNEAIKILGENNLRYEVVDSTKFNPKILPYAVIELFPVALSEVKKDRKIYLTLNPSGYRKISVPNIIQITLRNAESKLKAVGLQVGEINYINNIGKDMVLEIRYQGKVITSGSVIPKTSKIDLTLGNGKRW